MYPSDCTADISVMGLFIGVTEEEASNHWTVFTLTVSCTVHGLFVPWTIRTVDCSYPPWLVVPWTVRTVPGRFVPCWERQHSLYNVRQKKSPWGFLTFLSKRLGIFSPNFTGLLYVHTYGRLQIFIQFSPIWTNLYHTKCDHPPCVSADGGHFEHMMVIALNRRSKLQIIK